MQQQREAILENTAALFPGDMLRRFLLQIGITPVADFRVDKISQDVEKHLGAEVKKKVMRQEQRQDLTGRGGYGNNVSYGGQNIIFLVCENKRGFIGKKPIGTGAVKKVDQENAHRVQVKLRKLFVVLDKNRQQRDQAQTQRDNDKTYYAVNLPVKLHQCQNARMILFLNGLIELIYDRRSEAELRQRQHGKHVGEIPLNTEVAFSEGSDKNRSGDKIQDNDQNGSARAGEHIIKGVLRTGHFLAGFR